MVNSMNSELGIGSLIEANKLLTMKLPARV